MEAEALFDNLLLLGKAISVSLAALLPVVNPIGTTVILFGMTPGASPGSRRQLAMSVSRNTILILAILLLLGSYLLALFGISVPVVQMAGGLVLAAMGWQMLNQPEQKESPVEQADSYTQDLDSKMFYPFTFPITVGPGCVAVVLTLSAHTTHDGWTQTGFVKLGALIGIVLVGIVMYLCLAYSNRIVDKLGKKGTSVLMRLMAFIVVCIGAQISWAGVSTLVAGLK